MAAQPQQLTPQQIITQEDFMKLFDRGTVPVEAEKDSLKRPYPSGFSQFDPASKRPLPVIPQMQNNMLTHQHLMQQAALQAAMQGRTLPTTMQNSYFSPHLRPIDTPATQQLRTLDSAHQLRPLDTAAAQQMRQIDQQNAAQQYRPHEQAMAQRLQRQLPTQQMLQNQAVQMRNQQMTVQEYHNLLRLAQPPGLQQRRQTMPGSNMNAQMSASVARLQRPATTMEPPYSASLQFPHQIAPALSSLATSPISLATPIQLQQQNLLAQQIMSNAMRAAGTSMAPPPLQMVPTTQSQTPTNSAAFQPSLNLSSGMADAEFLAFLENVRQIEAHLTRTLAESIQRSTAAQQQS